MWERHPSCPFPGITASWELQTPVRVPTRCCHLCCTSLAAASTSDPAEDWWEFCIQEAQTHGNMQSSKGLQEFGNFFLLIFWKTIRKAQPESAVGERPVRAAQAGHHSPQQSCWTCREVAKLSLRRWIPTNMSYFCVRNCCDPFPPKLTSVLYCSHFPKVIKGIPPGNKD